VSQAPLRRRGTGLLCFDGVTQRHQTNFIGNPLVRPLMTISNIIVGHYPILSEPLRRKIKAT
jgi:hypothetical protein